MFLSSHVHSNQLIKKGINVKVCTGPLCLYPLLAVLVRGRGLKSYWDVSPPPFVSLIELECLGVEQQFWPRAGGRPASQRQWYGFSLRILWLS